MKCLLLIVVLGFGCQSARTSAVKKAPVACPLPAALLPSGFDEVTVSANAPASVATDRLTASAFIGERKDALVVTESDGETRAILLGRGSDTRYRSVAGDIRLNRDGDALTVALERVSFESAEKCATYIGRAHFMVKVGGRPNVASRL
jgi:hypothetical protein